MPPQSMEPWVFSEGFRHDFSSMSRPVQDAVLRTLPQLRIPTVDTDRDEGSFAAPSGLNWYFRRALTHEDRQRLDEAEAGGEDLDDEDVNSNPWDWFIIYRPLTGNQRIHRRVPGGTLIQAARPLTSLPLNPHDL